MGHNVGAAADRAVKNGEKVKRSERSPDQILKDLRNNLGAHLAVTPDDQRFLLSLYDGAQTQLGVVRKGSEELAAATQTLVNENAQLQAENEQFRKVYEQENCSTSVKVGKFDETGEVAVSSTVTAEGELLPGELTATVAQAISDSK